MGWEVYAWAYEYIQELRFGCFIKFPGDVNVAGS